jgi:hypothetical protein
MPATAAPGRMAGRGPLGRSAALAAAGAGEPGAPPPGEAGASPAGRADAAGEKDAKAGRGPGGRAIFLTLTPGRIGGAGLEGEGGVVFFGFLRLPPRQGWFSFPLSLRRAFRALSTRRRRRQLLGSLSPNAGYAARLLRRCLLPQHVRFGGR